MTRSVWVKADDTVGDWDDRRRGITAALEAGADWVLVDEDDVARVRELGDINVAAFRTDGDVTLVDDIDDAEADAESDDAVSAPQADAMVVGGKDGEGDATIDLPGDFSGSADLSTLRRKGDFDRGRVRPHPRERVRALRRNRRRGGRPHDRRRRGLDDHPAGKPDRSHR